MINAKCFAEEKMCYIAINWDAEALAESWLVPALLLSLVVAVLIGAFITVSYGLWRLLRG